MDFLNRKLSERKELSKLESDRLWYNFPVLAKLLQFYGGIEELPAGGWSQMFIELAKRCIIETGTCHMASHEKCETYVTK